MTVSTWASKRAPLGASGRAGRRGASKRYGASVAAARMIRTRADEPILVVTLDRGDATLELRLFDIDLDAILRGAGMKR